MGWSSKSPATQRWDGKGAPGDEDSTRPAADHAVPAGGGFLVEVATTVDHGTGYVFASQNPSGNGSHRADRTAFREFLGGIRF